MNNQPSKNLHKLFNPKSIAVVGASIDEKSVGYALIYNLISSGFKGKIYPVNPNYQQVLNLNCYPKISAIKNEIDLVIIAVPAKIVPDIVKQCGEKKVSSITIISAGFKEIGKEGIERFNKLSFLSQKYNLPILGPNCLGFMRPHLSLNASFAQKQALAGKIAFISQSGALCTAILDWANAQNVGFSAFISIGEMADLDFADLIEFLEKDPETKSILLYVESISDGDKFIQSIKKTIKSKPIIVLKSGITTFGASAATSHTGAIAGNDKVFSAALNKSGALRVKTIGELFDSAKYLIMPKFPKGNKLTIITNAGGPGVIATDYLIENNGELAIISENIKSKLKKILPDFANINNPVDILGDANWQRYEKVLEILLGDENSDAVLIILTPQMITEPTKIAQTIIKISQKSNKPIFTAFMGEDSVYEARNLMQNQQIPVFKNPENAIRVFMNLVKFSYLKKDIQNDNSLTFSKNMQIINKNKYLINKAITQNRKILTEPEAKQFLQNYGLPIPEYQIVNSCEKAVLAAEKIGYPVVLKIISADILHKTEIGGYKLNLGNSNQVQNAYENILFSIKKHVPNIKIDGVLVEKMISKRYELMVGLRKDEIFGPIMVFGTGGVAVEVFDDTNISLLPLTKYSLNNLIEKTKIYKLLKGYRGEPTVRISHLKEMLIAISQILFDFSEIQEIDINPLVMNKYDEYILDAKIILHKNTQLYWGKSNG